MVVEMIDLLLDLIRFQRRCSGAGIPLADGYRVLVCVFALESVRLWGQRVNLLDTAKFPSMKALLFCVPLARCENPCVPMALPTECCQMLGVLLI